MVVMMKPGGFYPSVGTETLSLHPHSVILRGREGATLCIRVRPGLGFSSSALHLNDKI